MSIGLIVLDHKSKNTLILANFKGSPIKEFLDLQSCKLKFRVERFESLFENHLLAIKLILLVTDGLEESCTLYCLSFAGASSGLGRLCGL